MHEFGCDRDCDCDEALVIAHWFSLLAGALSWFLGLHGVFTAPTLASRQHEKRMLFSNPACVA